MAFKPSLMAIPTEDIIKMENHMDKETTVGLTVPTIKEPFNLDYARAKVAG
jgi:hypothetical protein